MQHITYSHNYYYLGQIEFEEGWLISNQIELEVKNIISSKNPCDQLLEVVRTY